MTILRSQLRCLECNDLIVSLDRHDFRSCKCGAVYLDGGRDYIRVGGDDVDFELVTLACQWELSREESFSILNAYKRFYAVAPPSIFGVFAQNLTESDRQDLEALQWAGGLVVSVDGLVCCKTQLAPESALAR